jgi:hypothetical protein
MITIDNLAHRYGCLPSEIIDRATTFDLDILHISSRWEVESRKRHERGEHSVHEPSQETMLEMMKNVKNKSKQ